MPFILRNIFLASLATLSLSCTALPKMERTDLVIEDFEGSNYSEKWEVQGTAFGSGPAQGTLANQHPVSGFQGKGLVNSFLEGDKTQGSMISKPFTIERSHLAFLIGGGRHSGLTGMRLIVKDKTAMAATGSDDETLDWKSWDVRSFEGQQAQLEIFDKVTGGWGHINIDHIIQTDTPPKAKNTVLLEEYRKDPNYYKEKYRPQFHFTPEVNWMNDPNGLVYHDGEYHLFYQYNPFGNRWGHMSWGHAVSRDLVHWEHLPVALYEENGVMIFSGCSVVDAKNTSGFGKDGKIPIVAIYTGHQKGNQHQSLAYSLDNGRNWTKYLGNPVLDIQNADFRDPKVFWHEPTDQWVMIVALAIEKVIKIYGSKNLKDWEHLSDFGPAGVKEKANWECPDLFELPIEGKSGETRWVLEADMGNGSVAGGSGGEYFIGQFDGKTFTPDHPPTEFQWVDYGRDFYAPVSFSDIPKSDGRRIWIGWLNNWETHLVPTSPWRSAQSIPRTLSLREVDGKLRMIQRPVKELARLRQDELHLKNLKIDQVQQVIARKIPDHSTLEVLVTLAPGDATECGFEFFSGKNQKTIIGFDKEKSEVFVDRTQSGDSSFHKNFAGRHAAPVKLRDGTIDLHIFIDTSVVEVFTDGYSRVITDRIFPDPQKATWKFYQKGASAKVLDFKCWSLASIWKQKP